MESPVKKLDFGVADKENNPDAAVATLAEQIDANHKPVVEEVKKVEEKKTETTVVKHDYSDEPLLQENPGRFVLFPIKYHEVSDASRRVKWSRHATKSQSS
jgi:ribonucleoside-diphosphate reductase subunit M2